MSTKEYELASRNVGLRAMPHLISGRDILRAHGMDISGPSSENRFMDGRLNFWHEVRTKHRQGLVNMHGTEVG